MYGVGRSERDAPDEVLVLPRGADASDLEDKDAVVLEEVVDLSHERGVVADSDVLRKALR